MSEQKKELPRKAYDNGRSYNHEEASLYRHLCNLKHHSSFQNEESRKGLFTTLGSLGVPTEANEQIIDDVVVPKRYKVGSKILIAGFGILKEGELQLYRSFGSLCLALNFEKIDPKNVIFVLKEMTVSACHEVPIEYSDTDTTVGYTGIADGLPEGTYLTNQYPMASYGQLDDSGNRSWSLDICSVEIEASAVLEDLNKTRTPLRYTDLTSVWGDVHDPHHTSENMEVLKTKLQETLKEQFPEYKVSKELLIEELPDLGYVYSFERS